MSNYIPLAQAGDTPTKLDRTMYRPIESPSPCPSERAMSPDQHHATTIESVAEHEELTEEERVAYEKGILTWSKVMSWRFWIRREWIWYYLVFVLLVVLVALMTFFHSTIIDWLAPFVRKLRAIKVGWLIPIAIIFALSFPPLFGNEIVMILVGVVWGLGVGFGIVAAGVVLGELANYLVFKYVCRSRADKLAKKNLNYACLSMAVAEGGAPMAFIVRLSVIPTHVSTVVLAVCGLAFWKFLLALILGLPKQLIAVYVGAVLARNQNGTPSTNSHIISDLVFAATALITLFSMWYIYRKMTRVRRKVLIGMRDDLTREGIYTNPMPQGELSGHDERV